MRGSKHVGKHRFSFFFSFQHNKIKSKKACLKTHGFCSDDLDGQSLQCIPAFRSSALGARVQQADMRENSSTAPSYRLDPQVIHLVQSHDGWVQPCE